MEEFGSTADTTTSLTEFVDTLVNGATEKSLEDLQKEEVEYVTGLAAGYEEDPDVEEALANVVNTIYSVDDTDAFAELKDTETVAGAQYAVLVATLKAAVAEAATTQELVDAKTAATDAATEAAGEYAEDEIVEPKLTALTEAIGAAETTEALAEIYTAEGGLNEDNDNVKALLDAVGVAEAIASAKEQVNAVAGIYADTLAASAGTGVLEEAQTAYTAAMDIINGIDTDTYNTATKFNAMLTASGFEDAIAALENAIKTVEEDEEAQEEADLAVAKTAAKKAAQALVDDADLDNTVINEAVYAAVTSEEDGGALEALVTAIDGANTTALAEIYTTGGLIEDQEDVASLIAAITEAKAYQEAFVEKMEEVTNSIADYETYADKDTVKAAYAAVETALLKVGSSSEVGAMELVDNTEFSSAVSALRTAVESAAKTAKVEENLDAYQKAALEALAKLMKDNGYVVEVDEETEATTVSIANDTTEWNGGASVEAVGTAYGNLKNALDACAVEDGDTDTKIAEKAADLQELWNGTSLIGEKAEALTSAIEAALAAAKKTGTDDSNEKTYSADSAVAFLIEEDTGYVTVYEAVAETEFGREDYLEQFAAKFQETDTIATVAQLLATVKEELWDLTGATCWEGAVALAAVYGEVTNMENVEDDSATDQVCEAAKVALYGYADAEEITDEVTEAWKSAVKAAEAADTYVSGLYDDTTKVYKIEVTDDGTVEDEDASNDDRQNTGAAATLVETAVEEDSDLDATTNGIDVTASVTEITTAPVKSSSTTGEAAGTITLTRTVGETTAFELEIEVSVKITPKD